MSKNYKILENKVIYLNTETNCIKTTIDGKNTEYTWNIPSITIDELARLNVFNIQFDSSTTLTFTDNIFFLRLKNVLYNPSSYFSSDNTGYPLIFVGKYTSTENSYWNSANSSINIIPQTINTISVVVSDSLTNPMAGVDSTLSFVLGICIEQYDGKISEVGNPYGEANKNLYR